MIPYGRKFDRELNWWIGGWENGLPDNISPKYEIGPKASGQEDMISRRSHSVAMQA